MSEFLTEGFSFGTQHLFTDLEFHFLNPETIAFTPEFYHNLIKRKTS